jgi:hypothetical protein
MSLDWKLRRPHHGNSNRTPYRPNSIKTPSRIRSDCETATYFSSSALDLDSKTVYGGTNMDDITALQKTESSSTSTATDIEVNRLWSDAVGTSKGERVGMNMDQNPNGLTEFESTHLYCRVKRATMTFDVHPVNAQTITWPVKFAVLIYRTDEGIPSFTLGNTGTTQHTDTNLIPHMRVFTWYPNKGDYNVIKSVRKTIQVTVPQYFNDLEWYQDPVVGGNFWVAKSGSLFTAAPTAKIYARVYALAMDPGAQADIRGQFHLGVHMKWDVEFDRGDQVLAAGAT